MPELPEVETITQDLKKHLVGRTIAGIWSDWPKYFKLSGGFAKAKKEIAGRKILSIERLGKNIIFYLSGGYMLAVHLKMTGHFLFEPSANPSYVHLVFEIKKGNSKSKLYFSDVRKFGRVIIGKKEYVEARPEIKKLGPDPLLMSLGDFLKEIYKRRGKIKSVLLNQEFLAGVGNIYSDEALHLAKIHPLSRVEKIPPKKLEVLFKNLVLVLKKSIKLRGTTRQDYRDPAGLKGNYFNHRLVYARKGEKCPRLIGGQACGGRIETVKTASRTAHYCNKCQMLY